MIPEIDVQHAFMQWVEVRSVSDPRFRLIFPVCNNARGGSAMMGVLKKLGMRKGVHDVIGLIPFNGFHGFTIEFKSDRGKPTEEQVIFACMAKEAGYLPHLCRSFESAQKAVLSYLGLDK